jgi:hypothetical protein
MLRRSLQIHGHCKVAVPGPASARPSFQFENNAGMAMAAQSLMICSRAACSEFMHIGGAGLCEDCTDFAGVLFLFILPELCRQVRP